MDLDVAESVMAFDPSHVSERYVPLIRVSFICWNLLTYQRSGLMGEAGEQCFRGNRNIVNVIGKSSKRTAIR